MRACRTCLSKHHLYHIFDKFESNSDQLYLVTGVQISPEDGLPQTICKPCMDIITKTLHLRELSLSADQFLRSILAESIVKDEINENLMLQKDPFSADDLDAPLENLVNQSVHEERNSSVENIDNVSIHERSEDSNESVIDNNDENVLDDDIKPELKSNKSSEIEPMPETEFVDIQTKEEHAFDSGVEVRNRKNITKNTHIALYPNNVNDINRTLKDESFRKLLKMPSVVTSRSSKLTQNELTKDKLTKGKITTNQQTKEKHLTKCKTDSIENYNSETCQTILKNIRRAKSANGLSHMPKSKIVNLNSQGPKIANVISQTVPTEVFNPFDKSIESSREIASVSYTRRKSNQPAPILCETVIPTVKTANVIGQPWNLSTNSYSHPTNSFGQLANINQLSDSNVLPSVSSSSSLSRSTNMLGQSMNTLISTPNSLIQPDGHKNQISKRPTRLAKKRCLANLSQSANDIDLIDESSVELGNDFSDTDDIYKGDDMLDEDFTTAKFDETNDLTAEAHNKPVNTVIGVKGNPFLTKVLLKSTKSDQPKTKNLCNLNIEDYLSKKEIGNLFHDANKFGKRNKNTAKTSHKNKITKGSKDKTRRNIRVSVHSGNGTDLINKLCIQPENDFSKTNKTDNIFDESTHSSQPTNHNTLKTFDRQANIGNTAKHSQTLDVEPVIGIVGNPSLARVTYKTNESNQSKANMLCKLNKNEHFSKKEIENLFEDSYKFGNTQIELRPSCEIHTSKKVTAKIQKKNIDDKAKSIKQQDLFKEIMSDLKKKIPEHDNYIDEKQSKTNLLPGRKRPKVTSEQRQEIKEKRAKLMALAVNGNATESIECSICHDVLKTRASFKTHALKHFERQFVCKFAGCGKTFALRWGLLRHEQNRHGVKKRLGCTECAFRASDRTTMNNHVRADHTGEKPYECNECGSKFRMRNNIIQHIRQVHFRPGKTYQCEFCAVRCSCRRDLWVHQDKRHYFLYTFYCYLCDNKYKSHCSTKKHIMKRHGIPNDQTRRSQYEIQEHSHRTQLRGTSAPLSQNRSGKVVIMADFKSVMVVGSTPKR